MARLDNPGNGDRSGDCLFYAIAYGLISAIQKAPPKQGKAIAHNWFEKTNLSATLGITKEAFYDRLKSIELTVNPTRSTEFTDRLQSSLRELVAETIKATDGDLYNEHYVEKSAQYITRQEELKKLTMLNEALARHDALDQLVDENKITLIEREELTQLRALPDIIDKRAQRTDLKAGNNYVNGPIYTNFQGLVDFYIENPMRGDRLFSSDPDNQSNIFYNSKDVRTLARDTAIKISEELSDNPKNEECADKIIIETVIKEMDTLQKGVDSIKTPLQWGTQAHASTIFRALGINSTISTGPGSEESDMTFGADAPHIEIVNEGNVHWTTDIELPQLTQAPEAVLLTSHAVAIKKLEIIPSSLVFVDKMAKGIAEIHKESYRLLLTELITDSSDKQSYYGSALERAKDKKPEDLTDEELAATLQEEEFKNSSFKP